MVSSLYFDTNKTDAVDPKRGLCPFYEELLTHRAITMCNDDSSCDGSHKCCTVGKVTMCMLPDGVEITGAYTSSRYFSQYFAF